MPTIDVDKAGVMHRFVESDEETDAFVRQAFPTWEPETFETFASVADPGSTALDLGAWIGTTSIWLAHHFRDVVAVECDRVSAPLLRANLEASGCGNVAVLDQPVTSDGRVVVFGPRRHVNDSMSCVKPAASCHEDVALRSLPLHTLLHLFAPSFVKCDVETTEQELLHELLLYVVQHNAVALVAFHLDWWPVPSAARFASAFRTVQAWNMDERIDDPVAHLAKYQQGSLLFRPRA